MQLMQNLVPDLAAEMAQRALVLERLAAMAPVGRRQLAVKMKLTEREIRACADKLRGAGWEPKYTLEEGLKTTLEYFKSVTK